MPVEQTCDWCKGDKGWWIHIKGCDGDMAKDWEGCTKCNETGTITVKESE